MASRETFGDDLGRKGEVGGAASTAEVGGVALEVVRDRSVAGRGGIG